MAAYTERKAANNLLCYQPLRLVIWKSERNTWSPDHIQHAAKSSTRRHVSCSKEKCRVCSQSNDCRYAGVWKPF